MSTLIVIVATGCCATPDRHASAQAKPDLVFHGTVQSVAASSIPQSRTNWVVTFRVDRVDSGEFSGKTFTFRIHSPSKSGLTTGKQYLVEATRIGTGYNVDQYQEQRKDW